MIIKTLKPAVIIATALFTISCIPSNNDDLGSICKNSPELCSDIHRISDCRFKRTSVIRARYYDKTEPNEQRTYDLLNELDQYESCLELTLSMQFTRNKQRKQQRLDNYLTAQKLLYCPFIAFKRNLARSLPP